MADQMDDLLERATTAAVEAFLETIRNSEPDGTPVGLLIGATARDADPDSVTMMASTGELKADPQVGDVIMRLGVAILTMAGDEVGASVRARKVDLGDLGQFGEGPVMN